MITPLTPTRAALAAALCKVRDESEHWQADPPCRYCGDLADRLLAIGAVIDAGKLMDDEALVERVTPRWHWDGSTEQERLITVQTLQLLGAALSAR